MPHQAQNRRVWLCVLLLLASPQHTRPHKGVAACPYLPASASASTRLAEPHPPTRLRASTMPCYCSAGGPCEALEGVGTAIAPTSSCAPQQPARQQPTAAAEPEGPGEARPKCSKCGTTISLTAHAGGSAPSPPQHPQPRGNGTAAGGGAAASDCCYTPEVVEAIRTSPHHPCCVMPTPGLPGQRVGRFATGWFANVLYYCCFH